MSNEWPYVLEHELGAGSGGVIHAAVHRLTGVRVALKTVRTTSPGEALLLDRELAALAHTRHPYVLGLYDHGVAGDNDPPEAGVAWLALELASGGSLEDWVPTAWNDVRAMALHVLDGLAHAHARGLVHRDLKPANLLLCTAEDRRPGLKIADFGLAWARHHDRTGVKRGGTPEYIAPEQVLGRVLAFGPWTDLYAFGAMLWRWTTGKPTFNHSQVDAQFDAHVFEALPPFEPAFDVPRDLEALLRHLLDKDWQVRPPSAAAVAARIRSLGSGVQAPNYPLAVSREGLVFESALGAISHSGLSLLAHRELSTAGRRAEREQLWHHLSDVVRGPRARVVAVVGDKGSGCTHVARWLERRVVEVGVGEGHWIDGVSGLTGFVERALGLVASAEPQLRPGASAAEQALFAVRHDPTVLEVLRWLIERARLAPVVVRVDGALPFTLELLVEALLQRDSVPLLILATGRPGAGLWSKLEHHAGFHMQPLGPLANQDLLDLAILELGLREEAAKPLVMRCAGLPGMLVRWVRTLAADGRLEPSDGGFALSGTLGAPPAEDGATKARFHRSWSALDDLDRLKVGVGAVLGERVELEEWSATLAALDEETDHRALRQLWREGWLTRDAHSWAFADRWVHHRVLRHLPQEVVQQIHEAAVGVLKTLDPELARQGRLAVHLLEAGRIEEALALLHVVMPKAKTGDWSLLERLLDALERCVSVAELAPDDRFLVVFYGFEAKRLQSTAAAVADRFEALDALRADVSASLAGQIDLALIEAYLMTGRLEEAEGLVAGNDDVRAWRVRGMAALHRDEFVLGRTLLMKAFGAAKGELRAGVANALGRVEGMAGNEEASLSWFIEAAVHVPVPQRAVPYLNLAIGNFKLGRPKQAVLYGREALRWMDALGLAHRVDAAVYLSIIAAGANERSLFQRTVDHALYGLRTPERLSQELVVDLVDRAQATAEPEFMVFLQDVRQRMAGGHLEQTS